MSVRALILGGEGMLGRAMAREGRRRGWPALALSRRAADVRDPERLAYWMASFRPEAVFDCAAYTRVDEAETNRDEAFAVNGRGAGNAAEAAARAGAQLIYVSTDYVFDGAATTPYTEEAPVSPLSVYGASKRAGEEAVLAASDAHLVVRTSWLFGPGGPNFVATMGRLIADGKAPLRVVDDQVGCPTYTLYLASALWALAARGKQKGGTVTGLLHYRNRAAVSWYGLAREIARQLDPGVEVMPIRTADMPRPARRPAYSELDVSRFESLFGRRVEPWERGLADYLDLYQEEFSATS